MNNPIILLFNIWRMGLLTQGIHQLINTLSDLNRLCFRLLTPILITLIVFSSCLPVKAQSIIDSSQPEIDSYIDEYMRIYPIPGLALAIVHRDQIIYSKGYGNARPGAFPVTPQTPFMIASITKTFTALAIMQLEQSGKLSLDDPIQTYIPSFTLADPQLAAQITIRHLLNHSSGLSTHDGQDPKFFSTSLSAEELVPLMADLHPITPPGHTSTYSNLNYVLLGIIINVVSGQEYPEYVQNNIITPLGLTHTFFTPQEANAHGAARPYRTILGVSIPWFEPFIPGMVSSGYLFSSAEDLAHLAATYLGNGSYKRVQILSAPADTGWFDIYWQWQTSSPVGHLVAHTGALETATSAMYIYPADDLAVIILLNTNLNERQNAQDPEVIAQGIADLVRDRMPTPPQDKGFHQTATQMRNQFALILALVVLNFFASLSFSRLYRNAGKPGKVLLFAWVSIDILIGAGTLIYTPISAAYSWRVLLLATTDYYLPIFVLSILLIITGLAKLLQLPILSKQSISTIKN